LSHHNFDRVPEDLSGIVERATQAGADIVKVAARADSLADVVRLGEAGRIARDRGVGFAPIPMGPAGTVGRVLAKRFGADLTYAAARGLPATGPGQLDLDELLGTYRFRVVDGATRIYGILGRPALASLSPAMHNAVFVDNDLNAVYVPFEEQDLASFVPAAKEIGVAGLSVTQPFKESILPFLDDVDRPAQEIGAVNTVLTRDGRWCGFNTDVDGVVGPVSRRLDIEGKRAVVLGAGGAARAAAVGLGQAGAEVVVLARRLEQAQAVADLVGGDAGDIGDLGAHRWDILVNATPLYKGLVDAGSAEQMKAFRPDALILDMIYDPEKTEILELARENKAFAVPGLEMLVAQAVRQSEIWTGKAGGVDVMEAAARNEMRRRKSR
jgi:3-dehydroquinate dehydratase/shikimate dehydrogenase